MGQSPEGVKQLSPEEVDGDVILLSFCAGCHVQRVYSGEGTARRAEQGKRCGRRSWGRLCIGRFHGAVLPSVGVGCTVLLESNV